MPDSSHSINEDKDTEENLVKWLVTALRRGRKISQTGRPGDPGRLQM